jgi:hypothetical protein
MPKPLALTPAYSHVNWQLNDALLRVGIPHAQVHGCSDLVRARSQLLTNALETPADRFLFLDADVVPTCDQLIELAETSRVDENNAVTGLYLGRPGRLAAVTETRFSLTGGERYIPLIAAGMGFAAVDRRTIDRLRSDIPEVEDADGNKWHPYFLPLVIRAELDGETVHQYMSEDYSFWWRLRMLPGVQLWLDKTLVVPHVKEVPLLPRPEDLEMHFSRLEQHLQKNAPPQKKATRQAQRR